MFSSEFWQTFVQLLSFNGYILPEELHHYPSTTSGSDKSQRN
jgi:hypothetical protein